MSDILYGGHAQGHGRLARWPFGPTTPGSATLESDSLPAAPDAITVDPPLSPPSIDSFLGGVNTIATPAPSTATVTGTNSVSQLPTWMSRARARVSQRRAPVPHPLRRVSQVSAPHS
jgi:hypothetical protein